MSTDTYDIKIMIIHIIIIWVRMMMEDGDGNDRKTNKIMIMELRKTIFILNMGRLRLVERDNFISVCCFQCHWQYLHNYDSCSNLSKSQICIYFE